MIDGTSTDAEAAAAQANDREQAACTLRRGSIRWFREASPYIRRHRDATLVIAVPGSRLVEPSIATLGHDLALLCHLGLRVVLCFGLRAQVDALLDADRNGATPLVIDGRRVTDDRALQAIQSAAGLARLELEARLSTGLPDSPNAGSELPVSSGNLIWARPFGVHDGVDFRHTGTVREVRRQALTDLLDAGHLVIQPPLGHSLTGEMFNLPVDEVAAEIAVALQADKLVYLVDELPQDAEGRTIRQVATGDPRLSALGAPCVPGGGALAGEQGHERAGQRDDSDGDGRLGRVIDHAQRACRAGVGRVHLLRSDDPDALLAELYTRDGSGTLISAGRYDALRPATIHDVPGIIRLIAPLQENGTLATRSREQLELDIDCFRVDTRDGLVIACGAAFELDDAASVELGCIAVHPDYRGEGRADALLAHLESEAARRGRRHALLLSTRTGHWFIERGYTEASLDALPPTRRNAYNRSRASKVYVKSLG